ncbi:MAG: VanZ family protein [Christensenellaceae bacterium]|jgi:VanZ family protein
MKEKIKRKKWHIGLVLWILVIWGFSVQPGEASTDTSNGVLAFLTNILQWMGIATNFSAVFIRKMGHFAEYFILGMLLFQVMQGKERSWGREVFFLLLLGIVIAGIDESIQYFVPGRSAQIADVLLDFCGVVMGFFIMMGFYRWLKKKRSIRL